MRARTGKIARLPLVIREELNRRLLENQPAKEICGWLNGLPETKKVIAELNASRSTLDVNNAPSFPAGEIDDRNISDWRAGGFADWLRKRDRLAETREMAAYSVQLAKASGGNISEGAAAILAGQVMEVLEGIAELKTETAEAGEAAEPGALATKMTDIAKAVDSLSTALAKIRAGDHSKQKLTLDRERLDQNAQVISLDREKFQRGQAEAVLKAANDAQVIAIANSPADYGTKLNEVGKHLFGDLWKT